MSVVSRVIPILVYEDIQMAHDFLVGAFGFSSGGVERDSNGVTVHGEVRAGDFVIWLHRVAEEHNLNSQRSISTATSGLVVHVDDVDAHFERSKRNVAGIDRVPEDQPYGQREYAARDPEGHRWWFATPTRETSQVSP